MCCLAQGFFQMISDIRKSKSIKKVLNKLFQQYGEDNLELTDYWDADLCSIGVRNNTDKEYLVYISIYKIRKNHFFVEVENSNSDVVMNGYTNGELNEFSFKELSEIVEKYLHLKKINE